MLEKTRGELRSKGTKYVSAVTIHELQKLTLEREGKEVASLRVGLVEKEFKVISLDGSLAKSSGVLRSKYGIPLADSVIGATAMTLDLRCVTDDPHLKQIREIKTRWI